MATNYPTISNPVMIDKIIAELQQGLTDNISWLDVCFGRAQRLTKIVKGRTYTTPNVYCGGWNGHGENDYIEVSPDDKIGNFAFFVTDDPQTIEVGGVAWARTLSSPFALIVWFDLRHVFSQPSNRNTELLKAQVLRLLAGRMGWHLTEGRIEVTRIYDQSQNIYKGFTLTETENQFLMHPYGGFRIEGTLYYDEPCTLPSSLVGE